MRRSTLFVPVALLASLTFGGSPAAAAGDSTLVQLRQSAVCVGAAPLARAGAELVVPELHLWRLPTAAAMRTLPLLERLGAVQHVQRDRPAGRVAVSARAAIDPLSADEWWRTAVRVDGLTPPGPGMPVTVVDSGIDVTHPEFAGRPNTIILNEQEPPGIGGEHGTMVASVIGAPANGVGIVGIYPEAVLASWDAAQGAGTELNASAIVGGITAAARRGPGVINLSLGGTERDLLIQQAVAFAVARGSLVVAASGNDGEVGSPLGYPAVLPHVLTVAATDRADHVTSFSSRSPYVDLAAPGSNITVATAIGKGWRPSAGTSFSAPLASGAAAWVWTARPELDRSQVFEVLRRSARDIGAPGRDTASGFGLLDVKAALAYPAPVRDALEPNEDIDYLDSDGLYAAGVPPLTSKARQSTSIVARLSRLEDPRDVYRVWLPRDRRIVVTASANADLDLSLWRKGAASVLQRFAGDRLARAATTGRVETLRHRNDGPGRSVYLAVTPRRNPVEATYRLTIAIR